MTQDGAGHDDAGNRSRSDSNELERLLHRLAINDLSAEELDALGELLAGSEEARWAYIHSVHLAEGIKRWSRVQGEADVWTVVDLLRRSDSSLDRDLAAELEHQAIDDALLAYESASSQHATVELRDRSSDPARCGDRPSASRRPGSRRSLGRWAAATAAAALLAGFIWQGLPRDADRPLSAEQRPTAEKLPANNTVYGFEDSENVVARVTSATGDIAWSRGGEPRDFLMRLRPGDVVGIQTGLIELEFSDGALLTVESPAALQVTSANSARLIRGRVVGKADNGNFTLLTPTASVVDIGTEFGVGVSSNGTDVTVFEGEVHVHPLLGRVDSESMQRLQSGMSVRIDAQGLSDSRRRPNQRRFRRSFGREDESSLDQQSASLLDLISGHSTTQQRIAGSIDPKTGYWGRPPWFSPERTKAQRGDTQFASTDWNPMVDGVFIPRSNAREMQIDSDGHMVYLPPNSGSTWGPIWARRRFDLASDQALLSASQQGAWGAGVLSQVLERLRRTRDGLMGLHANVGITFDLNAVRQSHSRELAAFRAVVANLDSSPRDQPPDARPLADLRIFVNGKLRYSRLQFGRDDGDASVDVALGNEDRFLTIVATDAGADPVFDHVVLIDPVLEFDPPATPAPDRA